jgi:hypothetical protein
MIVPHSNLQRAEADPLPPLVGRSEVLAALFPPAYQLARKRMQAVCRCGSAQPSWFRDPEEYKLRCRRTRHICS